VAINSSIGTAWIQIKPTLKGVTNDLKRELSGTEAEAKKSQKNITSLFSGLGSNLKSTFVGIGKVAAATFSIVGIASSGAALGIGKAAVSAYADWEQLIGGVDTLFKDASGTVDKYAQQAFKAAGMSANQYMETVTGFSASLLQSLGSDTAKAAEYANNALIDMSDNANKMGTDMQSIKDAYQGFAKQNFTMLDNLKLGYGGTKTEMERLLRDAEKLSGIRFSIDSFADITKAIHIVQEQFGITGTTAKEAEETISGSLNMVKASWGNLLASMGGGTSMDRERVFSDFVTSAKTFAKNLMPAISSIADNIGQLFKELAPIIAAELPGLVKTVISVIGSATQPIVEVLPEVIDAIVSALTDLLSDSEQVNQIIDGFVKLFVAVAAGAGRIATAIMPLLPGIVTQICESLGAEFGKPENAGAIISGISLLLGGTVLKTVAKNVGSSLKTRIGGVFSGFFKKHLSTEVAGEASSSVNKIGSSLSSKIAGLSSTISSALKGLGEILKSAAGSVLEPIKTLLVGGGEAIAGLFKAFSDPAIALGAVIFAAAAAAIAASIFLIGSSISAVMPTITALFNEILMPLANFIAGTVLLTIAALTDLLINLTNSALIPLGEFMTASFIAIVDSVTNALAKLAQDAVAPLLETLGGAFSDALHSVADLITGVLQTALDGIAKVTERVGDGFKAMGEAIRNALDGVNGILGTFRDLILGIADAVVAVAALATGHSIDYGPGFAHISRAATGGRVDGVGTDTSDSNLYALSKGEYVIRAAAARQVGYDNLDYLNQTGSLGAGSVVNNFTIIGYNKSPEELANIISRKIALNTAGVY